MKSIKTKALILSLISLKLCLLRLFLAVIAFEFKHLKFKSCILSEIWEYLIAVLSSLGIPF